MCLEWPNYAHIPSVSTTGPLVCAEQALKNTVLYSKLSKLNRKKIRHRFLNRNFLHTTYSTWETVSTFKMATLWNDLSVVPSILKYVTVYLRLEVTVSCVNAAHASYFYAAGTNSLLIDGLTLFGLSPLRSSLTGRAIIILYVSGGHGVFIVVNQKKKKNI